MQMSIQSFQMRYYLVKVSNSLTGKRKDKKPDYHWVAGNLSNAELLDREYQYADHSSYSLTREEITQKEYQFATR